MKKLDGITKLILVSALSAALAGCGRAGGGNSAPVNGVTAPARGSIANSVTDAFGPLIVREGEFDAEIDRRPWSGSWLPLKSAALFDTGGRGVAPLQKYDLYMQRVHGVPSHAADAEKNNPDQYNLDAQGWEGHCDAWATASVSEPEPSRPVTIAGIAFTVGDLKDLLIETYERSQILRQFGKNFAAGPGADYNEIYPDQFHRAVQHELFENNRLIVFDSDATEQVWNTPMYRAIFQITADARDASRMHVDTFVSGVKPLGVSPIVTDPNYVGTITATFEYTYDLVGYRQADGSFRVVYGEWTGHSIDDHPNFVSLLTSETVHSSLNPEIKTEIVNEILAQAAAQHAL